MTNVTIYTTPTCHFCHDAMDYFKANNIAYNEINVVEDKEAKEEIIKMTKQKGVPVIKIGEAYIVGFNKTAVAKELGLMV